MSRTIAEPYKIKMVEPLRTTTHEEREHAIKEAGYNTFLLHSDDVYIDLLTDSGTNGMSNIQWSKMFLGDESYAGASSYYVLEEAMREIYGFKHLIPTHQGRGAEHLTSITRVKPGQYVPMNMYFTTTRAHVEMAGGIFYDCIIDEAHDTKILHPFKGNVDIAKLQKLVDEVGPEGIAYLNVAPPVNMAGGQPMSMKNLREVRAFADRYKLPVIYDATRAAENAYFIQQREEGYKDKKIKDIFREMMSLADGCTVSAKKDNIVNIGGFMATNDDYYALKARELVVVFEGMPTYGGLAGRDLEAMAQGMHEMVDDAYIASRIRQVEYLGQRLIDAGVPVMQPIGGHAVFLDATAFLPHIPQENFPAQALAAALYVDSGVRSMERGIVSAGRDPKTGKDNKPKLELVRLTIPRRVYTNLHMDVVAESCIELYKHREQIKGLKMVYEPESLRFFQARFEPLP
ncbi:MAG TPA: tyrosine phenol-lyase [Myxococcota bacterium]|nr:tyrosine phenol-lyase [Oligoflexales bacterium]HOE83066.1 tyrosine phenol-lyase [Myxococcota bacterium]HON25182.1 tyrosine phenol-lyase [Myxococcota bacterium]HOS62086.1 tyrosine phenol-lyase [Myxococcota bacterium]HPL25226.1 tyrosine phenol-lyase [Myxococcota bacterium]